MLVHFLTILMKVLIGCLFSASSFYDMFIPNRHLLVQNTRTMCEICSELTINIYFKVLKQMGVFVQKFEKKFTHTMTVLPVFVILETKWK